MDMIVAALVFGVLLIVLMLAGIRIAITLGAVGMIGLYIATGGKLFSALSWVGWNTVNSFILTAVPLFIFLGELILISGMSKGLYTGLSRWFELVPGGLFHSNIVACAIFSAICGTSMATAATVGSVAIPELEGRGYDRKLALGSLAAGGTLGILIPPSIIFIIYGALVDQSIGQLFMAGVIPGIILTLMFMAFIFFRVVSRPQLAPRRNVHISWSTRIWGLKDAVPVVGVILIILGGIYLGWVTPTEAAAVGALVALITCLIYRKLSWRVLGDSLLRTTQVTSMALLIVIGAQILQFGMVSGDVPREISRWILSLPIPPWAFMVSLYVLYVILGCFLDGLSMMLITLPVLYPAIVGLGFDPIWFGVVLVVLIELGALTPPVGMNLFVIHAIAPKSNIGEIARGVLPFVACQVALVALLSFVPSLATWLPSQMITQ